MSYFVSGICTWVRNGYMCGQNVCICAYIFMSMNWGYTCLSMCRGPYSNFVWYSFLPCWRQSHSAACCHAHHDALPVSFQRLCCSPSISLLSYWYNSVCMVAPLAIQKYFLYFWDYIKNIYFSLFYHSKSSHMHLHALSN
jgi:hypothetical protein